MSTTPISTEETISRLWKASEAAWEENEFAYWLLDRSALPAKWLSRHAPRQPWIDLLRGNGFTQQEAVTPVLVEAHGDPKAFFAFAAVVQLDAKYANAVALITTPADMGSLQRILCSRARIELPQKLEVVLRFFDTRTLPVLPAMMTARQYAQFVRSITAWHYLDRYGEVQSLPPPQAPHAGDPAVESRCILSVEQEAMLIDDGMVDAIIDTLLTQGVGDLLTLLPPQQFDQVVPLVDRARQQGKQEHADVFEFVAQALQVS